MRARLIVNPVAGSDRAAEYVEVINRRLRPGAESLDIVMTTGEGDAAEAAREAVLEGRDHLFVAGGDGTLNEALNGAAAIDGALAALTFGLVPLGTGNDFATALGIPEDVDGALDVMLGGTVRTVDVGTVNGRRFLNVSAGGFLAEVSDAVPPQLKTVAGKLAYLIGGAQIALAFEPFQARIVRADGLCDPAGPSPALLPEAADLYAFAVCNAPLVGGGRPIAPLARPDDGRLDVCLMRASSMVDFLALLRRVPDGGHISDDRVLYVQAAALELAFDRPLKINADGQVIESSSCVYGIEPGGVRVLAPPDAL